MKKSAWFFPLFSIILSAFVSCDESNMELYVGTEIEPNDALQKLYAMKIKSELNDEDATWPFLKNVVLENELTYLSGGIVNIVTGLEFTSGVYGYVDLGLSVDWSLTDLNYPIRCYEMLPVPPFDEFYQKATKDIEPVAYPGLDQSKMEYPTIMSYEEYVKQMSAIDISWESIMEYEDYVRKMNRAYTEAVHEYNNYCSRVVISLVKNGSYYAWGAIDGEYIACSDAGSPQNIAGNPQYDIATKFMGEKWRLPTRAEWQELVDKCQWEKTRDFYIVTGPSGKSIILPIDYVTTFSRTYCTSERSDNMDSSNNKYDVYQFDLGTKQIVQRGHTNYYERRSCVRPVHIK